MLGLGFLSNYFEALVKLVCFCDATQRNVTYKQVRVYHEHDSVVSGAILVFLEIAETSFPVLNAQQSGMFMRCCLELVRAFSDVNAQRLARVVSSGNKEQ